HADDKTIIKTARSSKGMTRRSSESDSPHTPNIKDNKGELVRSPRLVSPPSQSPPMIRRSISHPITIAQVDGFTASGKKLMTLSMLFQEVTDRQAITVVKDHIFDLKMIKETTHEECEKSIKSILDCMAQGSKYGLINYFSDQGIISLPKMITQ